MGYRLHVHKKHIIEYGSGSFSNRNDSINDLLAVTCCGNFNNDDVEFADEIELVRKDFKKLYSETLQGTDDEVKKRLMEKYDMNVVEVNDLKEIGFKYIADNFKAMDENSEEKGEYIHFSWY